MTIEGVSETTITRMKFNDKEIAGKGNEEPEIEGVLQYLRPQSNDWSTWYSAPSFKERKFRLRHNLLFYYRAGELADSSVPLGLLVLENATVRHERPVSGVFFAFSVEFGDEQRKYIFACKCQEEANNWVHKLKSASYEYLRSQLVILQKKISMRTGLEPDNAFSGKQGAAERLEWTRERKVVPGKSSFRCHLASSEGEPDLNGRTEPPVQDLIQF